MNFMGLAQVSICGISKPTSGERYPSAPSILVERAEAWRDLASKRTAHRALAQTENKLLPSRGKLGSIPRFDQPFPAGQGLLPTQATRLATASAAHVLGCWCPVPLTLL